MHRREKTMLHLSAIIDRIAVIAAVACCVFGRDQQVLLDVKTDMANKVLNILFVWLDIDVASHERTGDVVSRFIH